MEFGATTNLDRNRWGSKKGKTEKKKRKTDLQLINDINRKLASRTNCKSICKIDYPYVYTEGMERAV